MRSSVPNIHSNSGLIKPIFEYLCYLFRDTLEQVFVCLRGGGYSFECLGMTQPGTTDIRARRTSDGRPHQP